MDSHQCDRFRVWRVPVWIIVTVVLAVFWMPFYDAIVHGQVICIITGILALAIGRKPFVRGLFVGLAAALKPPFALLIPFVSVSFGWYAFWGCVITASLAWIPPDLFIDYLSLLPDLAERPYEDIGLVRLLGKDISILLALGICVWITIRWRGTEKSYMGFIAAVVIGTALWFHSYTPLVIPVTYWITRSVQSFLSLSSLSSTPDLPRHEKADDSSI